MSLRRQENVTCPHCGEQQVFTVWDSINVSVDPEAKRQLLRDELMTLHCRRCGRDTHVAYDCLYHDMDRSLLIWLKHPDENGNARVPPAAEAISALWWDEGYTRRLVTSSHELIEKVLVFDAGLSDYFVELVKLFICSAEGIDVRKPFHYASQESSWFRGRSMVFALATDRGFTEKCYLLKPYESKAETVLRQLMPTIGSRKDSCPRVDRAFMLAAMQNCGLIYPVRPGAPASGTERQKLAEGAAAAQFSMSVLEQAKKHWPQISHELTELLRLEEPLASDDWAGYDFALAAMAVGMQALPNLLPTDQAARIREYVLQSISAPELGTYPRDTVQEYQRAWDELLSNNEPPHYGVASVLYDKLKCDSVVDIKPEKLKDPLLLMALAEKVIECDAGWWKRAVECYDLVS